MVLVRQDMSVEGLRERGRKKRVWMAAAVGRWLAGHALNDGSKRTMGRTRALPFPPSVPCPGP